MGIDRWRCAARSLFGTVMFGIVRGRYYLAIPMEAHSLSFACMTVTQVEHYSSVDLSADYLPVTVSLLVKSVFALTLSFLTFTHLTLV